MRKLALIGAGRMGGALLTGWLAGGLSEQDIVIVDPYPGEAAQAAIDNGALHSSGLTTDEAKGLETVFLAIKPQMFDDLMPAIASVLPPKPRVVSVLAGITLAKMEAVFGRRPIIRAMPNTPAAIGKGITGYVLNSACKKSDGTAAANLLKAGGKVLEVSDEGLIDVVTGISGSGPAYVFYMVEALCAAGIAAGMPKDDAMVLARQTIVGAGGLLETSPESAGDLRVAVTSPGGTTQAGLEVLMADDGLELLMKAVVKAAVDRSRELGS